MIAYDCLAPRGSQMSYEELTCFPEESFPLFGIHICSQEKV